MHAVYQVNVGPRREFSECSRNSWVSWAKQHGMAYAEYTEQTRGVVHSWLKLTVLEILDEFDRIVLADYDTIVSPACPNFLGEPGDPLFAVADMGDFGWIQNSLRTLVAQLQSTAKYSRATWCRPLSEYFNAGVVVIDRQHRPLLEEISVLYSAGIDAAAGAEQSLLNLLAYQDYSVQLLPHSFNFTKPRKRGVVPWSPGNHQLAHILHFNEPTRAADLPAAWEVLQKHVRHT